MSKWDECRAKLLDEAGELRARLGRLLDKGASPESAAEIEALRARLRGMEARLRELSRPGGPLDELRRGAERVLGELRKRVHKPSKGE